MGIASDILNAGMSAIRNKGEELQRYKAEAEQLDDETLIRRIRSYSMSGPSKWRRMAYCKEAEERGMTREEVFGSSN